MDGVLGRVFEVAVAFFELVGSVGVGVCGGLGGVAGFVAGLAWVELTVSKVF